MPILAALLTKQRPSSESRARAGRRGWAGDRSLPAPLVVLFGGGGDPHPFAALSPPPPTGPFPRVRPPPQGPGFCCCCCCEQREEGGDSALARRAAIASPPEPPRVSYPLPPRAFIALPWGGESCPPSLQPHPVSALPCPTLGSAPPPLRNPGRVMPTPSTPAPTSCHGLVSPAVTQATAGGGGEAGARCGS